MFYAPRKPLVSARYGRAAPFGCALPRLRPWGGGPPQGGGGVVNLMPCVLPNLSFLAEGYMPKGTDTGFAILCPTKYYFLWKNSLLQTDTRNAIISNVAERKTQITAKQQIIPSVPKKVKKL